jgi:hypothetical protein
MSGLLLFGYSFLNHPRIPFQNIDYDLFWPDRLLRMLVRNKNIRTKMLKKMYPAVTKVSKFLPGLFHLFAGKKLKKFNSDQSE